MEKCVDSNYIQSKNDATKAWESTTGTQKSCLSSNTQEKGKCQGYYRVPSVRKKIASRQLASDPKDNAAPDKRRGALGGRKLNVLNKHVTESTRQSVQKKTKIIKRNVPDRLGKYASYNDRSETKLSLTDCKAEAGPQSDECSPGGRRQPPREHSETESRDGRPDTKLAVLGKECLSNKEAVRLRNSFESDLEKKHIFENFFDDCLGSTSNGREASSQENADAEGRESGPGKGGAVERTPETKGREASPPGTPVKAKDHSNYYSSHKNIRHVCAYCQKIFKSNGKLNSHVYSHTGERPFDCSHCGKAFSSKFKLVRHLLIHSEIRKFVCQICDRTFLRNDHLKNHYKVHDPQKKMFKCPKENCDKEYSSIMSHKKHMAYHNVEDGDLKCLICNVKYETKEEVLFHLKSHSGSRLFKSQSDKKFKCDFCERLFLTRKDVTRHLVVHTGERDFLCQFCPQRFGRKDHLVRHIKKSHGNEDLVKGEPEGKQKEEPKTKQPADEAAPSPCVLPIKENNTQTEEGDKTRIVITVQGKARKTGSPTRKRKPHEKKPFQKNEPVVPRKKQVPLAKGKNSTTQILLENIPNILIIPNNSIILLRNQAASGKGPKEGEAPPIAGPEPPAPPSEPRPNEPLLSSPHPVENSTDFVNFGYDSAMYPPPSSQLLGGFPEQDNFCSFQMDLPPFAPHFEEPDQLNFEMLNNNDLLPRGEAPPPPGDGPGNLPEAPRQTNPAPEKAEREKAACEELFQDGHEALMLNESILNEFKDESSAILSPDNEVGILSNLLNQSNDNCGFELLRNLLTGENPALSPLPGFSQIFHNSNANSG